MGLRNKENSPFNATNASKHRLRSAEKAA